MRGGAFHFFFTKFFLRAQVRDGVVGVALLQQEARAGNGRASCIRAMVYCERQRVLPRVRRASWRCSGRHSLACRPVTRLLTVCRTLWAILEVRRTMRQTTKGASLPLTSSSPRCTTPLARSTNTMPRGRWSMGKSWAAHTHCLPHALQNGCSTPHVMKRANRI